MTEQHIADIRQLSAWLAGTDIALLELTGPERTIRLRRDGGGVRAETAAPAAAAATPVLAATVVRAGSVGIYLPAHPLRSEPLVRAGQQVAEGQPVALLKIGLVLLAVPAPRAGTVARVVATPETAVGFGDPLVELE